MGSRREEERNEKIIRGLMKLPPNRRCINCNSLGPQYVCTNFWTFICMTCSGIHREFTHRVKSVSMSKFTSQEVEALQNGGNQRARDIYLKDWDLQRQRLPDSSNADKIREFIKSVYVDRKYAGEKTSDKPPRDMQSPRNNEDEIRRASSYHSYSQSPPYDYQYEDRRYGKQVAAALSRKPGSDRGLYMGKVSSFVHSPGRLSDQMSDDRFANEGSAPRVSGYSVSCGGDAFNFSGSPNFQKDIGFATPTAQPPRDVSSEDTQHQVINLFVDPSSKKDAGGIPHPQRTKSMGSFGSFDSNSMPVESYKSCIGPDVVSEPEQTAGSYQDKASTISQSSVPVNYGGLDLFNKPEASAAAPIDLFQLPATPSVSSKDIYQPTAVSSIPLANSYQPPLYAPSIDLFARIAEQPPPTSIDEKLPPALPLPKSEGWATFDTPQHAPASDPLTKNLSPAARPGDGDLPMKFDQLSSLNTTMVWPIVENSSALGATSSMSSQLNEGLHNGQASIPATSTQSWNAFDDSAESLPVEPQVVAYNHLNLDNDGIQTAASYAGFLAATLPSENGVAPSYAPLLNSLLGEKQLNAADCKSTNPFDLPYDSEFEQSDMFLDMSSLQTALPDVQLPSTFLGGVSQPWFPQNPVTTYFPATPQGGLAYMSGQTPSSQISNVSAQGPVASIGENPFA
ncbi:hypothetical protein PTKIN_Ptkin06aG0145700 [Pterospermum kingtungense]